VSGTVEHQGNSLVHHCHCGKWGAFGFDVALREGKLGAWYCGEHRPDKSAGEQARVVIRLSDKWKAKAIDAGKARRAESIASGRVRHGNGPENPEAYDINGCFGEVGVAAHYKLPWQPGGLKSVDVGGIIEVRARPIPGPGRDLGIRLRDRELGKEQLPFVLAWVYTDDYRIELVGWLYGHEGMDNPARWDEQCKCWWNPPPYRPLHELEAIIPKLLAAL
jgi:hypothetical protein